MNDPKHSVQASAAFESLGDIRLSNQSQNSPHAKQLIFIGNFAIIAINRQKSYNNPIAITLTKARVVNLVIFCCHAQALSTHLN